jgi:hypothetical protein
MESRRISFLSHPARFCRESRFHSDEELARLPGVRKIDAQPLSPGPSPDVYAFYRGTTQRNLYRIPIP